MIQSGGREPGLGLALVPVGLLLVSMTVLIVWKGAYAVQEWGQLLLLASGIAAGVLGMWACGKRVPELLGGLRRAAREVLPSIPILLLIGTVSATWMLSGVVPALIDYGLQVLNPNTFLVVAATVCAVISVLSGSSWTTIATIGVALMGIGTVMGYEPGWIAGAIISGAYFGDKLSPLSDTTVLASSSCGVNLFAHIRNMLWTTLPSFAVALLVFFVAGITGTHVEAEGSGTLVEGLRHTFNITPWLMTVPVLTGVLIARRTNSYLTLGASTLLGLGAMLVAQPQVVASLAGIANPGAGAQAIVGLRALIVDTQLSTGSELLESLVGTGGMMGMLPTVWLVMCATVFGGMMIGSGMLRAITEALRRRFRSARASVTATVASGLGLNACTGDQFLSIIISANIYRDMYRHNELPPLLLSRTVEDSVSVTSVIIPWNSCGLTQATVLGVPTLVYLPYCVFNILSPLVSLGMAWGAVALRRLRHQVSAVEQPA